MHSARWLSLAATAAIASVSTPAFAQWSPGLQGVTNDVLGSVNRPLINSDGIEDDEEYADSPSESDYTDGPNARLKPTYGQPAPSLRATSPRAGAITRLDFTPSPPVRRASVKLFLDALGKASPEDAANLRAMGDPIALMAPELAKAGLRTNDLGDAFALYWVVAWRAAHGQLTEPDDRLFAAVRRQTAPILAGLPRMDGLGPEDRQAMTESLLLHALLIEMNRNAALESPERFDPERLADAARRDARMIGLDLDAYRLGMTGFVLAR